MPVINLRKIGTTLMLLTLKVKPVQESPRFLQDAREAVPTDGVSGQLPGKEETEDGGRTGAAAKGTLP
jgi:hypothetical protein